MKLKSPDSKLSFQGACKLRRTMCPTVPELRSEERGGAPMKNQLGFSKTLKAILVVLVVAVFVQDQALGQGGAWVAKAPIPTPRLGIAVGVVNGVLYALGGSRFNEGQGSWETLATVEAYDPSTNSWTTRAPMPIPRVEFGVGVVDGILYVLGGYGSQIPNVARLDAYDPVRNTWTAKEPMPTPRHWLAVGAAKGALFAVGGWDLNRGGQTALVEAYDPTTNTWTTKSPMPTPRAELSVGVVNGILYAVGGSCCAPGHGSRIFGTVEAYDPATNQWTARSPMPTPRHRFAVGVANGVLYAVGGHKGTGGNVPTSEEYPTPTDVVEAYDPAKNVWTMKMSLPGTRNFVTLGSVNGILYAVGGTRWELDVSRSPTPHGPIKFLVDPITYAFRPLP
jgi:N-acetylneuraminic acid mutarotase